MNRFKNWIEQIAAFETTPEFQTWFGNSKTIDKEGKPLVFYHGTKSPKFLSFDPARIGTTDRSWYGKGFYFTTDLYAASTYGGNIIRTYLKIENPLELKMGGPSGGAIDALQDALPGVNIKDSIAVTKAIKVLGHDGVVVRGRPSGPPKPGVGNTLDNNILEVIVFDNSQIKIKK